ncbi:MAG: TfoX/Sxy family protein [Bacteroidota bacterium]
MAYTINLADRIRESLVVLVPDAIEKEMFGGLVFMVNDKMCIGVIKDEVMCRIDPVLDEIVLERNGCRPMDFSRKSMKGFVFVNEDELRTTEDFEYWIQLCLDYNPKAKASKKKPK